MACPELGAWTKPPRRLPPREEPRLPWPLLLLAGALVGVLALAPRSDRRAARTLDGLLPVWARDLRTSAGPR